MIVPLTKVFCTVNRVNFTGDFGDNSIVAVGSARNGRDDRNLSILQNNFFFDLIEYSTNDLPFPLFLNQLISLL